MPSGWLWSWLWLSFADPHPGPLPQAGEGEMQDALSWSQQRVGMQDSRSRSQERVGMQESLSRSRQSVGTQDSLSRLRERVGVRATFIASSVEPLKLLNEQRPFRLAADPDLHRPRQQRRVQAVAQFHIVPRAGLDVR